MNKNWLWSVLLFELLTVKLRIKTDKRDFGNQFKYWRNKKTPKTVQSWPHQKSFINRQAFKRQQNWQLLISEGSLIWCKIWWNKLCFLFRQNFVPPLFPPALHDYIVIETSQPIPSRAEEPNIASITKSTPSKSCLMDPLQEKEIVLKYLPWSEISRYFCI